MSELLNIAHKLLEEATATEKDASDAVNVASRTLVKRRATLEAAQKRVRDLHADVLALKRQSGAFRVVSS